MTMWTRKPHRHALLELWATGELKRRAASAEAWDELLALGWAHRSSRRDIAALTPEHRDDIGELLDRCWPAWRSVFARLEAQGLPADARGIKLLAERTRARSIEFHHLPPRINRRTAAAMLAEHSKVPVTDAHRRALGDRQITHDSVIRIRPHDGLVVTRGEVRRSARDLARLFDELLLTERACLDGTQLRGTRPRAVLLVENKGAFIDVTVPDGWLIAHLPGWDMTMLGWLLAQLPDCPVIHFGDLDPDGLEIFRRVQVLRPDARWFVPELWVEELARRERAVQWPSQADDPDLPALVRRLIADGLWLEQEPLVLNPRLTEALATMLYDAPG